MMEKVFYAHAGAGNHGCEAIVRATCNILGEKVRLFSINPEQDIKYGLEKYTTEIILDVDKSAKRYSAAWFRSRLQTKLTGSITVEVFNRKKNMLNSARENDIWFSIGGDNYCYPGTEILAAENSILHKKKAKTVLWGCSVEPCLLEQNQTARDLSRYDLIIARESISYNALKKVNPNTHLYPDPAFTLGAADCTLPEKWQLDNMVGINISPLILDSAKDSQTAFCAYKRLVDYILTDTDMGIALIPHVVWENNDDRIPLKKIYDEYKRSGRVVLVEDHNCEELKGYISKCRFFVGARTHATIAAYSTCVPTLVLGYSVKSRGIAKDIFGTENHYVLSVQNLASEMELVNAFQWIQCHEAEIRSHLKKVMPEYVQKAYGALTEILKLL